MTEFDYTNIDDVIHSRIRTAVMAVLSGVESAEFTFLKQKIGTTDGNLSIHLRKLEDKNYIKVTKEFVGRKPISRYSLTSIGRKAFEDYVNQLEKIINK